MRTFATLLLFASILFAQDPAILHHFDYEQKAPLDIQEVSVAQRAEVAIHDISYASPKGDGYPLTWWCRREKDRLPRSSGDTGIRMGRSF